MQRTMLMLPVAALLSGCVGMTDQQAAATLGGAVIGAVVSPGDPLQGAIIGGAVGLAAGTFLGYDAQGNCVYERQDGTRFLGACP